MSSMRLWMAARRVVMRAAAMVTVGTGALTVMAGSAMAANVPTFKSTAPPGSGKFTELLGYGLWAAIAVCVAGFMYAGGKLAIAHREGGYGGGAHQGLVSAAIGCVVVGAASGFAKALI